MNDLNVSSNHSRDFLLIDSKCFLCEVNTQLSHFSPLPPDLKLGRQVLAVAAVSKWFPTCTSDKVSFQGSCNCDLMANWSYMIYIYIWGKTRNTNHSTSGSGTFSMSRRPHALTTKKSWDPATFTGVVGRDTVQVKSRNGVPLCLSGRLLDRSRNLRPRVYI